MRKGLRRLAGLALCLFMAGSLAYAQGSGSSSLSGLAVDSGGGVIPGATVVVKNNTTSVSQTVVTNSSGAWSLPGLPTGVYTVTVSLSGFKTVVINDVRLVAGTANEVKATLEVGQLTESIVVKAGTELVQTQSATVQSSLKVEQLQELPLVSRNTLYAVTFLPGVESPMGQAGNGPRQSTINGLPQNTLNISIDGITTGNQLQSTDGFFSMVTPRLDAVEEITMTGAVPGSTGSQGSVKVEFVTRSGGNTYESSIYHYMRRPQLNSNYFFNKVRSLPRNEVIVDQYGGRIGGPIRLPGYDGRGKAFFFFNFEHQHQPSSATRTRTILNPDAQRGVFTYLLGSTPQQINLYALAAANGQTASPDPTIGALLAQIRDSTNIEGTVITPANATNTQQFSYQSESANDQYAPTTRVDLNLTTKHRLTGTYWWQRFKSNPDLLNNVDPQFPGFPNFATQNSYRTTGSITLRSTLSPSIVNEVKSGWQWSPNEFFTNVTKDMFNNQGGFTMPLANNNANNILGLSSPTASASPAPRNTTNWSIDDTLNYLRGNHAFSFGGGYSIILNRATASTVVPTVLFGVNTANDPANAMFTTANFPNASTANLTDARNLYALLTGRVTGINATARLDANTGKYVYNGDLEQKSKMDSFYGFVQDSWKLRPDLTFNLGLRYEVQLPFRPVTATYSISNLETVCGISGVGDGVGGRECNLFEPGNLAGQGVVGSYTPFAVGTRGFNTDWNNLAPNLGVAWQPGVQGGFLRAILGDPDQATLRGGYAWSFNLERMDRFTGLYGNNPGGTSTINRSVGNGNLVLPGESWPLLYRDQSRLGPPATCPAGAVSAACMPDAPSYPIPATTANSVNIFDPNVKVPHVESWSVGLQRSVNRDTAVEVRYLGNRNQDAWTTENWNERVLFENGFMDEFKRAMGNLQSHVAAGCSATTTPCSFAYRGPGTGTQPLPTYLAYFLGRTNATDPAAYTGTNWTNTSYTGDLSPYNTNITSTANDLHNDTTFRANAIAAGLAPNFFQMNPGIGNANVTKSLAGSRYHSMQVELRRRLSRGLLVQASYTYAKTYNSNLQSLRFDRFYLETAGVPHAFKMNWTYDIPFGQGRRYGTDTNAVANAILGGWEFSGSGRVQRQQYNAGSIRLVGMSKSDLQKAFHIRQVVNPTTGALTVFSMEQDIIDNTRRAYNTDPTSPTGYGSEGAPTGRYIAPGDQPGCVQVYVGDCNTPKQVFVYGPAFVRFDMRMKKMFNLGRKVTAEINFEVFNVFDNVNFNHQMNPGAGATIFQVTSAYTDINTTFDPGGRLGQIAWRITF